MTRKETIGKLAVALVVAYLITTLALVVFACVLCKFHLGLSSLELGVTGIYLLSSAIGGFWMGKKTERRHFLWGMLVGCLYVVVLFAVSMIARGNLQGVAEQGLPVLLLCLCGGTLGGMLS